MIAATRILLIDDDEVDRTAVRRALSRSGLEHELVEAANGASGLHLAQQHSFDCVLLDYRLPDVDTFELLETLLSPRGGSQSVMILTGETDQGTALRMMRLGALDYLSKSDVTPSGLARAIRFATARGAFLAELAAARRDAEQKSAALDMLNRQKSLLFSIIAHDLRNPFQALLSLSAMLNGAIAAGNHDTVARRAKSIGDAAEQAHALMEGLFAWATLQMDSVAVTLSDVGIEATSREVLGGMAPFAAEKEIALHLHCEPLQVRAHPDMLAAILRNLVSNAIKFTRPGGSVTISAQSAKGVVGIAVTDTGVGMDAEQLAGLFEPEHRSTTKGTAGERGSGLGLLLCRELAQRQGGELAATSQPGRGTTFTIRLGLATAELAAADASSPGQSAGDLPPSAAASPPAS